MNLFDLIERIKSFIIFKNIDDFNKNITRISVDSRDVDDSTVFFALKGEFFDGHKFVKDIKNKVALIVGEKDFDFYNYIKVSNSRDVLQFISEEFYNFPQKTMFSVGITGTNGKTTTASFIHFLLSKKVKTGLIGTLGYKVCDKTIIAQNTTPFIWKFFEVLKNMNSCETKAFVSEVSSHSLVQSRIGNMLFDVAVFTNFSRDHLDFHKSFKNYLDAKKLLFSKHLKTNGVAVINIDDEVANELLEIIPKNVEIRTFSLKNFNASLFAKKIEIRTNGTFVTSSLFGEDFSFFIPFFGAFNILNAFAAILSIYNKVSKNEIVHFLKKMPVVSGRMERVGKFAKIFVDYAHTPDAMENVLKTAREFSSGKIFVVFGAGGDRDKGKRAEMAKVVQKFADFSIVTSDNPRNEQPINIIKDIKSGFSNFDQVLFIENRAKAISKAIDLIDKNDTLLILGKGAEDYQIFGNKKIHFSDKEEVLNNLKRLKND